MEEEQEEKKGYFLELALANVFSKESFRKDIQFAVPRCFWEAWQIQYDMQGFLCSFLKEMVWFLNCQYFWVLLPQMSSFIGHGGSAVALQAFAPWSTVVKVCLSLYL